MYSLKQAYGQSPCAIASSIRVEVLVDANHLAIDMHIQREDRAFGEGFTYDLHPIGSQSGEKPQGTAIDGKRSGSARPCTA